MPARQQPSTLVQGHRFFSGRRGFPMVTKESLRCVADGKDFFNATQIGECDCANPHAAALQPP
jgi:hypothetical protein